MVCSVYNHFLALKHAAIFRGISTAILNDIIWFEKNIEICNTYRNFEENNLIVVIVVPDQTTSKIGLWF